MEEKNQNGGDIASQQLKATKELIRSIDKFNYSTTHYSKRMLTISVLMFIVAYTQIVVALKAVVPNIILWVVISVATLMLFVGILFNLINSENIGMKFRKTKYQDLRDKYGLFASWAIWDEDDQADTEIIENSLEDLNPEVIIVSPSISTPMRYDWQNFHGVENGEKLMRAFNKNEEYNGAYMTVFVKDIARLKSVSVQQYLEKKSNVKKCTREFKKEVKLLEPKDPLIILLDTEDGEFHRVFKKCLGKRYKKIKTMTINLTSNSDSM